MSFAGYIGGNRRKLLQFGLVGGGVFLGMHVSLLVLVEKAYWNESVANVVVQIAGIAANYALNKKYTWPGKTVPGQTGRFVVARLATTALSVAVFNVLLYTRLWPMTAWPIWFDQAVGITLAMGINFVVTDRWVFAERSRPWQLSDLDNMRVGWRSAVMLLGTLSLTVAALHIGTSNLFWPTMLTLLSIVALLAALLFLVSMLYPHRDQYSAGTLPLRRPDGNASVRIGALMPAWQEVAVLARTIINTAWTQRDHPSELHRFFPVLCDSDPDTIRVALEAGRVVNQWWSGELEACSVCDLLNAYAFRQSQLFGGPLTEMELAEIGTWQRADALVQIIIYDTGGQRSSKAKQMNCALRERSLWDHFDVVTIIDAEDDVQPELFSYVDQAFRDRPDAGIIQGAVQLMDPEVDEFGWERLKQRAKRWYAYLNLLEYHRWFSGQMRFQAERNVVPLGGNTVFLRGRLLKLTGGYIDSLAEDCATGILATAVHGAKTYTFYDPALATREQVPPATVQLVKQRVRWTQGFLQTFLDGHWKALPTMTQKLLALWILTCPFFQALSATLLPVTLVTMVLVKSPPWMVLVMCLPLIAMVIATCLQVVQLAEFSRAYDRQLPWHAYVNVVVLQFPYQALLSCAALWAVIRHIKGDTSWHRTARPEELAQPASSTAV